MWSPKSRALRGGSWLSRPSWKLVCVFVVWREEAEMTVLRAALEISHYHYHHHRCRRHHRHISPKRMMNSPHRRLAPCCIHRTSQRALHLSLQEKCHRETRSGGCGGEGVVKKNQQRDVTDLLADLLRLWGISVRRLHVYMQT